MKTIYKQALEHYGIENQENKAIEEMAELIQAICKQSNIAEEIADTQIMLDQLKIIYPHWADFEKIKLNRLNERINTMPSMPKE